MGAVIKAVFASDTGRAGPRTGMAAVMSQDMASPAGARAQEPNLPNRRAWQAMASVSVVSGQALAATLPLGVGRGNQARWEVDDHGSRASAKKTMPKAGTALSRANARHRGNRTNQMGCNDIMVRRTRCFQSWRTHPLGMTSQGTVWHENHGSKLC